ncbi:ECF sigma factor [Stieleria maiorica]|uniref:ECF sigma factor n=1 Tax=Stieleria maiorica TaxID=2795974 RepID=A0A5B9M987_9BACT|nr:ECF-type sigma factor [Stieleria maiorica]QEF96124.1 ECF sigma factor [Stieleria maiorica]
MSDDRGDTENWQPGTTEEMLPRLYGELRMLAASCLRMEQPGQTLQATALVHEAFLRLAASTSSWDSEGHFFASAAKVMRRVLVDNARRKQTIKHGGAWNRVELFDFDLGRDPQGDRIVELDDLLHELASLDHRAAQIVEFRVFAGMTFDEIACALADNTSSVFRDWVFARAWLASKLQP